MLPVRLPTISLYLCLHGVILAFNDLVNSQHCPRQPGQAVDGSCSRQSQMHLAMQPHV